MTGIVRRPDPIKRSNLAAMLKMDNGSGEVTAVTQARMKVAFPSVIAVEMVKKKKWVNSEYILMVDPTEIPDGLDISAKARKLE